MKDKHLCMLFIRAFNWIVDIVLLCSLIKKVILELKSVAEIQPIHKAQLLTYLKLSEFKLAMLLNFNVQLMKDGINRFVNNL